jgi:hypothetical protein
MGNEEERGRGGAQEAQRVGQDSVLLLAPHDYDGDDEKWEFVPGTVVRVERRVGGVDAWVAVSACCHGGGERPREGPGLAERPGARGPAATDHDARRAGNYLQREHTYSERVPDAVRRTCA